MDDKRLFMETDSRHSKMPVLLNYTPFMGDIPFIKDEFNPSGLQLQHFMKKLLKKIKFALWLQMSMS